MKNSTKNPVNTSNFQLEKGVPVPPTRTSGQYKYPFRIMEVGDSFFVPESDTKIDSVRGSATDARKKTGFKYAVRRADGGCRVWRVS